ncbi:MAG TPA: thioesterase family protein [Anaeromyxobacteraceae bacterium]|nr:thioesterase family protein [Anaeromyxobacteraceae bacterium]
MVRIEIRVIYGDTDQMGVVYYANYLRYFEAGRSEFLRAKGLTYRDFEEQERLLLPVVEAGVSYHAPARYDDLLGLEIRLTEARRATARFEYDVRRGEDRVASGFTVHACVDTQGRVRRMPRDLIDRLAVGEDLAR